MKRLSLQAQIFICCVFLIIMPPITLGITTANNTAANVNAQFEDSLSSLTSQIDININTLLADAEKILNLHILNDGISKIMSKNYGDNLYDFARDTAVMNVQMSQANRLNPNVLSAVMKNKYGYIFQYGINTVRDNAELLRTIDALAERAHEDPNQKYVGSIYRSDYSAVAGIEALQIVKILRDVYSDQEIGVFYLEVNFKAIAKLIQSSRLPNSKMALINRENKIFFSSDSDFISDPANAELMTQFLQLSDRISADNPQDSFQIKNGLVEYYVNIRLNRSTGWKIVHFMDNSVVRKACFDNIMSFMYILILSILLSFLIAYFVSRGLTRSITSLCEQIDSCTDGNVTHLTIKNKHFNRELDKIISSYNNLNQRLADTMTSNYIIKANERKMNLKMLQMQINPHFLYNTLNMISSIANIRNVPEIKKISDSMSELLRYNLKSGPMVSLAEEIHQLKNYLSIQQARFPDRFSYRISIPDELLSQTIPAFILQPLVENSVVHGLETIDKNGVLDIEGREAGGCLLITIHDNGAGIEAEKLLQIQKSLENGSLTEIDSNFSKSVGILNVHQRIQTYYGKEYGLTAESRKGSGTVISIRIPARLSPQLPEE